MDAVAGHSVCVYSVSFMFLRSPGLCPFHPFITLHVGFNDDEAFPDLLLSLRPFNVISHLLIHSPHSDTVMIFIIYYLEWGVYVCVSVCV